MKTQISNQFKKTSGFSLIELMVVVAIIGILATIAIPNFQRFQARSRQSSAKTELASIFTAQKGFFAEYQTYHAHMPMTGFVPEGVDQADLSAQPLATSARVYGSIAHRGADAVNIPTTPASLGLTVPSGDFTRGYVALTRLCGGADTIERLETNFGATINPVTTQNTFRALASGCPRASDQTVTTTDLWTINERRELINARSGI